MGGVMSRQISAEEAANILKIPYTRLLQWTKRNYEGLGKAGQKVGWGWIFDEDKVIAVRQRLDKVAADKAALEAGAD
jgi:hypothetical protein